MENHLKFILKFFILSTLLGCASASNKIDFKKIKPQDRVYFGSVNVQINGHPTSRCEVYFGYDIVPSVKLSQDGYLVYRSSSKALEFSSLACPVKVDRFHQVWLVHSLDLPMTASAKSKDVVSYIGQFNLTWTYDVKEAIAQLPVGSVSSGPQDIIRIKNIGDIQFERADHFEEAKVYLLKNWPILRDLNIVDASHADHDKMSQ